MVLEGILFPPRINYSVEPSHHFGIAMNEVEHSQFAMHACFSGQVELICALATEAVKTGSAGMPFSL